jgi:arylformamidase
VADVRGVRGALRAKDLDALSLPAGVTRVLLKTDNSELWRHAKPAFPEDYVSLSPEGAQWMLDRGVRLVGTDFLSIEAYKAPGHPTHHTLLAAGAVIVEGLDLSRVEPGRFTFTCLPLRVIDGDGAPARAILTRD